MRRVLAATGLILAAACVQGATAQVPAGLGPITDTADPLVDQVGASTIDLGRLLDAGSVVAPAAWPSDHSVAVAYVDCDGTRACSVVVSGVARTSAGRNIRLGRWATFVPVGQERTISAVLPRRARRALRKEPLLLDLELRIAPMLVGRVPPAHRTVTVALRGP